MGLEGTIERSRVHTEFTKITMHNIKDTGEDKTMIQKVRDTRRRGLMPTVQYNEDGAGITRRPSPKLGLGS